MCLHTCFIVAALSVRFNFLKTNILQGSVEMRFRCAGIFSDRFIANLPLNVAVKKL